MENQSLIKLEASCSTYRVIRNMKQSVATTAKFNRHTITQKVAQQD